jgi:hypothetical protein
LPAGLYFSDLSPDLTIQIFVGPRQLINVVMHTYAPTPFLVLNLTDTIAKNFTITVVKNKRRLVQHANFEKSVKQSNGEY